MTLPYILAETNNMLVLGQIGNGKSTAIAIAMAKLVTTTKCMETKWSSIQVLCFVHKAIGAVQMKRRLDLLNKYSLVTSNTGRPLTSVIAKSHILIGTPQELAKVVLNDQIPVNRVEFVFFDDADVTMKFDCTKSAIIKLSGFAKFIGYSSSVVHNVNCFIPDIKVLYFCDRSEVMSNKITHYVAEVATFISKIFIVKQLIDSTEENVIIFSSVSIFV